MVIQNSNIILQNSRKTKGRNRFLSQKRIVIDKADLEKNPTQVVAELLEYLQSREKAPRKSIPLSIFSNTKLTVFEAMVKFLREEHSLTYQQIGDLVERKTTTISTTYQRALKKMKERLLVQGAVSIPLSHFKENATFSPLEMIVDYLHTNQAFPLKTIAQALNRDIRTIWTVYHRALQKRT